MAALSATVLLLFVSLTVANASTLRCPTYLPTNGAILHSYDVTKYYKCDSSRYLIEMQCDPGLEFDSRRAICVKSTMYVKVVQQKNEVTTPCPCPTTTECPLEPPVTTTTPCPCPTTTECPVSTTTTTTTTTTTLCPHPPCPPITTTTRCPEDECKDGEEATTRDVPSVTPPPPDYCQTGERDVERPVITTPLPC